MMTWTSALFLAVEKHGGEGRILTGRWFGTASEDESMLAGRLSDTDGRIDIDAADDDDDGATDIEMLASPLIIWLDVVSMPLRCLSLQAEQTRWPMGKMLPFFMWFPNDILVSFFSSVIEKHPSVSGSTILRS